MKEAVKGLPDMLREVCRGDDQLGERHVVVRDEDLQKRERRSHSCMPKHSLDVETLSGQLSGVHCSH